MCLLAKKRRYFIFYVQVIAGVSASKEVKIFIFYVQVIAGVSASKVKIFYILCAGGSWCVC